MPTYGYRCPTCGHEYEKLQNISDATRIKCPRCGKRGERLISGGAGIIFKGSGFYETDYRSESYKKDAKAEKDAAKPKTEGKADSKSGGDKKTPPSDGSAKPAKTSDKSAKKKPSPKPKGGP